jgi:hypothetical protein
MKQSIRTLNCQVKTHGEVVTSMQSLRRRIAVATAVVTLGILPFGSSIANAHTMEQIKACAQTMHISVCINML